MDRPIVAVVLAGGTGTRLYPAARSDRPKQFLSFGGDRSLLERTVDRLDFADDVVVSTREEFVDGVEERVPDADVLVEPQGKDTGPALAYATHVVGERYNEPVVLCLPSDHWIEGDFGGAARSAARAALETGGLVTMGIEPDRPATGYGYVRPGEDRGEYARVEEFREKPDEERATELVDDGCLWNSGMFAWTPAAFRREARGTPLDPLVDALDDDDPDAGFEAVESTSVDYAVLERAEEVYVVPVEFAWDDLGTWDAIDRVFGDVGESLVLDADGTFVAGDEHVTAIGVSDLVIAAYDDRILVVPKDAGQRVRDAVEELRESGAF